MFLVVRELNLSNVALSFPELWDLVDEVRELVNRSILIALIVSEQSVLELVKDRFSSNKIKYFCFFFGIDRQTKCFSKK